MKKKKIGIFLKTTSGHEKRRVLMNFANGIKIEGKNFKMTEPQLRYVVRNVLFENQK